MARPHLLDDGRTVTLDLHGATVAEGLRLVRRAASLASERGRDTLRVVHGTSTSDPLARNRTLKHALHELLDNDELAEAQDAFRAEGHTLISFGVSRHRDPTPIRLINLR